MNSGGTIQILASLIISGAVVGWLIWRQRQAAEAVPAAVDKLLERADKDVEHIFDNQFRQELRNRGRLHFEKIIGDNAMFLQQDLRQTTAQLNEYMRTEITRTLQEEFKKYEQSITDAKQIALDSIEKTSQSIEQQRQVLQQQLYAEIQAEKVRIIDNFEKQMSTIINHYVLAAIGNQIDLSDQLDYILSELEANKAAIAEDIRRGT